MPAGILVGTREEAHYPGSQPRPFAILSPLAPGLDWACFSHPQLGASLVAFSGARKSVTRCSSPDSFCLCDPPTRSVGGLHRSYSNHREF